MRPTNIHNSFINQDIRRAVTESGVQENIWDVDVDALDTVTFKDCYADGHNQSDRVAGEWLLLNFKYMCPATIDSDVLVDKSGDDYKWSRLEFEQEEPVDASEVLPILEATGLTVYGPGEYEDCKWPCVELTDVRYAKSDELTVETVDEILQPKGWEISAAVDHMSLTTVDGCKVRTVVWSVVPIDRAEDEDEDGYEDGWHGILLNSVFLVDEERDAAILNEAGFRVLKHEDTGTVIAQVTFCGMSNEANRARAGFLLAVERGWPILTEKGWRRPVR